MAATITYTSNVITISGAYKSFTGSSTPTVVTYAAGEAPAVGDAGRFIVWLNGGTGATAGWQIRRIVAADATTITIHDPWVGTPSSGDTFRISSNADDILAAQPSSGSKTGSSSYAFIGSMNLAGTGFFGTADESIDFNFTGAVLRFTMAAGTIFNAGQLWGGEGIGRETTNGSRISYNKTNDFETQFISTTNARIANGPVFNFFGSLIEAKTNGGYLFARMNGPARFIGSVLDGELGGRFHHEASELIDSRISGNINTVSSLSLGANFTRPISNIFFFQNLGAVKGFGTASGTFRDCILADSNTFIASVIQSTTGAVFDFIDSTNFGDSKIQSGGNALIRQFKGVNFSIFDTTNTAIENALCRINNASDVVQGSIQISNSNGIVPEILVLKRSWLNSNPSTFFDVFKIRIRKYGFIFSEYSSSIEQKVEQQIVLNTNLATVLSESAASALTGITIDYANNELELTSSKSLSQLYDFCQASLATSANIDKEEFLKTLTGNTYTFNDDFSLLLQAGAALDTNSKIVVFGGTGRLVLNDAANNIDGLTIEGIVNVNAVLTDPLTDVEVSNKVVFDAVGTYTIDGGNITTVENTSGSNITINVINGAPTPTKIETSGTITLVPDPVYQSVTLVGGTNGSRVQLYDLTGGTEIYNNTVTFPFTWTDPSVYSADRQIRLRVSYQDGTDAKQFIDQVIGTATFASPAINFLVNQVDDDVYINNAIDGELVTGITIDDSAFLVEIDTGSTTWPELYAYETYWLFTEQGIRDEARFILARDEANYIFFDFQIKNITSPSVPLTITGGWARDSVTGLTETLIDTTGGTIFSNPDIVISYATGSGVTAGDITAIADAVWDEDVTTHTTTDSTGKTLTEAKEQAALSVGLS